VKELKESLYNGLKSQLDEEEYTDAIDGSIRPGFIPQVELNDKALQELKPMHEEWAGVPLHGSTAYGLRVYHNESSLLMHVDKPETHVISCILHVDHDPESDPWPIVIEDYQGNTNEVTLESGDMLFYESSKCLHGRPRKFNGDWYSSLFVHYKPADWESVSIPNARLVALFTRNVYFICTEFYVYSCALVALTMLSFKPVLSAKRERVAFKWLFVTSLLSSYSIFVGNFLNRPIICLIRIMLFLPTGVN